MFSWKERLYALLLRRILGPLLSRESHHDQLLSYTNIQHVSLTEGSYTFNNVSFNTEYIASHFLNNIVTIVSFTIQTIHFDIRLVEEECGNSDDSTSEPTSSNTSLAWRALKFSIHTASNATASVDKQQQPPPPQQSTVSLVVHIRLEGIAIMMEPSTTTPTTPTNTTDDDTFDAQVDSTASPIEDDAPATTLRTGSNTASFLSSFLESVLASLRLSMELHDVRIRIQQCEDYSLNEELYRHKKFIDIHTQSIFYQDQLSSSVNTTTTTTTTRPNTMLSPVIESQPVTNYETIRNKVLDITRISILTGSERDSLHNSINNDNNNTDSIATIVGLLDGTSCICFRVVEYNTDNTNNSPNDVNNNAEDNSEMQANATSQQLPYTQQDIQVSLHQKLNISVDVDSLQLIRAVVHSFTIHESPMNESTNMTPQNSSMVFAYQWVQQHHSTNDTSRDAIGNADADAADENDEADYQIIESIMAQYREARLLVEKKEIRGGILYPSLEDNGQIIFDTFFDANESLSSQQYRHSSMLKESLLGSMLCSSYSKQQPTCDWIYRKFTLHLQEGGIKLTLPSSSSSDYNPRQQYSAKEYVLLTFNDINLSVQMLRRSSNYALTVNHIEIEDASLVHNGNLNEHDGNENPPVTEVGTMLRFVQDGDCDDDDEDDIDLLVQAPCLSITMNIKKDDKNDTMDWDIIMEPIEISHRHNMMTQLIAFFQDDASNNPPILEKPKHTKISVNAACVSLTFFLPLSVKDAETPHLIYDRAGYTSETTMVRESAFGFVCERLAFELLKCDSNVITNDTTVSCHNIIVFATTPVSRYSAFDNRTRRLDFISMCGDTEIDPCIPISIRCNHFSTPGSSDENVNGGRILAESLLPKVPLLSSYKARQEDDDDETTPKSTDLDVKFNDPQSAILLNITDTDTVVTIHVPEVVVDLSALEVIEIQRLMSSVNIYSTPTETVKLKTREDAIRQCTACSITSESISLLLHVENSSMHNSVFALSLEDIKAHCALDEATPKHLRVLVHDFDFLEILMPCQDNIPTEPTSARERARILRTHALRNADCIVHPLIYRSYLFIPISPLSPSIHLDFFQNSDDKQGSPTTTVYLNLFHISYRHQYDCAWIQRLSSVLSLYSSAPKTVTTTSLMRLFISVVDCNIDYLSPQTFQTASRLILRIGDIRLSSNLVSPGPQKQAFSCTIANTEMLLCCTHFAYNFENGRLVSAIDVMKPAEVSMYSIGLPDEAGASDVLRLMNYRTMATFESINMQIIASVGEHSASDPAISITVSTRQICVFACRDSLARLSDTIGEASAEMTAITTETFEELRSKSFKNENLGTTRVGDAASLPVQVNNNRKGISSMQKTPATVSSVGVPFEFLLDGYDWTAIDSDEIGKTGIPQGEEQSARWFVDGEMQTLNINESESTILQRDVNALKNTPIQKGPPIITHHFNLLPVVDPVGDGDMGATKFANATSKPKVQARVIVRDLAIRLRFFDGYDWPELLNNTARNAPRSESFIIPEVKKKPEGEGSSDAKTSQPVLKVEVARNKKSILLEDLLIHGNKIGSTFADIPLPDEHAILVKEQAELRRLVRRTSKYFQIEASGVVARIDSMKDCEEHRLVSCVNVMINDLFLAESISSDKPVKMLGEWFNDQEHPRDSKEGLVLMKMVTWHPLNRITPDNKVENDESDVCIKINPLRCIIDQRAVAFIRAFFNTNNDYDDLQNVTGHVLPAHLYVVPPPLFTMFRVQPLKLKVDYRPQKLDTSALRNGAVVELINFSPLDGMVLTLKSVNIKNEVGFGAAMSLVVRRWVEDICATQLHKFVTKSRPFEPITEVGSAVTDIVVLPWEAFRNHESITKALKAGAKSFSRVAIYELLNTSSRVANFVGANVSRVSEISSQSRRTGGNLLPDRPVPAPRTMLETGPHALESLSRGLQEANYTIVIVPYREYHRSGATGAAYSVMRGIPVAIAAPTSGAAEALSYALLGARNQIRPDMRKEDEVSHRGLHPN